MKQTKIELTDRNGNSQTFDVDHAERILRLPNTVWRLTDTEYEFTTENGIVRNKKKGKGKTEGGDYQQSVDTSTAD